MFGNTIIIDKVPFAGYGKYVTQMQNVKPRASERPVATVCLGRAEEQKVLEKPVQMWKSNKSRSNDFNQLHAID